ncbi:Rieske (2Fe-2S) protein [Streptomyces sp. P1-3]|uniref:Rieske (2Fe-2S) protein n=1 Tax=Streptomyces sp. P1-3 TaxID=3421658 RepID=UPI003D36958B
MAEKVRSEQGPTRRTVVAAVGAAGLAAALAACGDDGDGGGGSKDAGGELGRTGEIPEGGGKIFKDQMVVVTQPSKGEFKAFSAECTHSQCPVTEVTGGTINCPCHGSKFSIADGSVQDGPARRPLPPAKVTVKGDTITLA